MCPLYVLEPGTNIHVYWKCQSQTCTDIRKRLAPGRTDAVQAARVAKRRTHEQIVHVGASAETQPLLRSRGLIADPLLGYEWGSASHIVFEEGVAQGEGFEGSVALDGSLKNAVFRQLRVGGWAAVTRVNGELKIAYGSVPLARPTSQAAEMWAVLQVVRMAGVQLREIITDCAAVVRGLENGRSWCTMSCRPNAALWQLIWNCLEDRGLIPNGNLNVRKAKAHRSKATNQQVVRGRKAGGRAKRLS